MKKQHKILFFSNQGISSLSLGYELEILNSLTEEGKIVYAISCDNNLSTCFFNPTHNLLACAMCEARTQKFHNQINNINKLKLKQYNIDYKLQEFNNLNELIDISYKDINIGRGIASSIISLFREYDINKIENIKEIVLENAKMAINVIQNFEQFIAEYSPDEIYLFNGRFTEVYALTQLCKKLGITYKTYETGSLRSKYMIKKNITVHNIASFQEDMAKISNEVHKDVILREGGKIFEERMTGNQGEYFNFLMLQEKGFLPKNFNVKKQNITMFNSSEDEMKVIKDWTFNLYNNQGEAIVNILNHFKNREDIHFYLRVHPNLMGVLNSQTEDIKRLNFSNLTIIEAHELVDTYSLINASDKVISFGSTVGVEASYLKKPSILLGNAFYKGIDCVYEPNNYEDLFELINNKDLLPKQNDNIYLYIYTAYNRGIDVRDFISKGKNNSLYNGKQIKRIYPSTFFYFIKYLKNIKKWKKMSRLLLNEKLKWSNLFRLKSHTFNKTHQIKK
jgi:hypothetical protein